MGSLCTGYGGLDLGVLAAFGGGRVAWCADPDPHIRQILDARMPGVPNLGDLRLADWYAVDPVDVLTAGFPCQDISAAGKRAGIEKGARSGVWADIVACLRPLRPPLVVLENVAAIRWASGGLHRVLGDLAAAGYDALWRSVRACDVGAAHRRERLFLLAWPNSSRNGQPEADRARQLVQHHHDRWSAEPHTTGSDPSFADAQGLGHRKPRSQSRRRLPTAAVATGAPARGAASAAADAARHRRNEGLPAPTRLEGRPDAALGGRPTARPTGTTTAEAAPQAAVNWASYEAAIRRWEAVLGRPTPHPVQPGAHGRPVLAPRFVEHLMGLPEGWVTDLALPRTAQLRALGNGVVPCQATHAVSRLLDDLAALLHHDGRFEANEGVAPR
ncbi:MULTISPECIES: DNA cytosine methyltransferase [Actinosynnema]|uniref:DNA cytosine methyltransferase n=1 Tax=Actinosynnema TaxID=40566 RepID=UPI0020A334F7|nr:DNA cytosine methyltransferase [Actinosynnema pretiosum]MCP2094710.1 DNA (cytosine-5)-methyltransferase 1 [Actinosynnema pretiosum]